MPDRIPALAKALITNTLSEVKDGDIYEVMRNPMRGLQSNNALLFDVDADDALFDLLSCSLFGLKEVNTMLVDALLQTEREIRVWMIYNVRSRLLKASLVYEKVDDGVVVQHLFVSRSAMPLLHHETLLLVLCLFADTRRLTVHVPHALPTYDVMALTIGFVGFMVDNDGGLMRSPMTTVSVSQKVNKAVFTQMHNLLNQQNENLTRQARDNPDPLPDTAAAI